MASLKDQVYQIVKSVPKGQVATYGQIAEIIGNPRLSRQVGWALHANTSSDVPCHRVVNRDGRLAPNFAFNGPAEQKRRLEGEGIVFTDSHVDLNKYLWSD